jgi:AcrR family transcriptional regulator
MARDPGVTRRRGARPSAVRTRLDVEERRAQLVDAATRLFTQRAYDEVSMDDVAAEAGVSKALVFHYFSTKRELYVEVVERRARELIGAIEAVVLEHPELGPLERLRAGLDAYLRHAHADAPAYLALLGAGIGMDREIAAIVERTRRVFADRLLEQLPVAPRKDTELAVRGFLGFVEAASVAWLARPELSREELVERLVAVLGAALAPLPSGVSAR